MINSHLTFSYPEGGVWEHNYLHISLPTFAHKIYYMLFLSLPRQTNIPIFKLKGIVVRRRYSDFEWPKERLERDSRCGFLRYLAKLSKDSFRLWRRRIFDEEFIDDRKKGLEEFVNKISGHPLAQNERCLHMFLQEPVLDRSYVPGKVRSTN
ncbi:Sorting nexin-12 [Geodia barretti]|uniref:Sorting nexin-3 n=1 Tax=Geodia barretti TaxID=519541 RepID=A0AA35XAH1_GEOBA|nr:Sorting nexin-12 [Geodia barretti]